MMKLNLLLPFFVILGIALSFSVNAQAGSCSDPDFVVLNPDVCSSQGSCSDPDFVVLNPDVCGTPVEQPAPVCVPGFDQYGPIPSGVQIKCPYDGEAHLACNSQGQWELVSCIIPDDDPYTPSSVPVSACTSAAWSCTGFAPLTCPSSGQQTSSCTLIDATCSNPNSVKPAETQSCTYTPIAANNAPVISSFNVPSSADKGSGIAVSVTASDSDGGVDRIEILDSGSSILQSQSCGSIASCTKNFVVSVPNAFSAAYTFIARVFDSVGASVTQSKSGVTDAAPLVSVPKPVSVPSVLEKVRVRVPVENLFLRARGDVPDSGCVSPGQETFLYASMKNDGSKKIKDVKVTVIAYGLDIRSSAGPFDLDAGDSASRLLYFGVPSDAQDGEYYLKLSVSSDRDNLVRYMPFDVRSSCN